MPAKSPVTTWKHHQLKLKNLINQCKKAVEGIKTEKFNGNIYNET